MGLCKCPKRNVTTQFCFEHRVNVCENCMVSSHSKCIVQSYLQWLKDSDYDSICILCNNSLENGDCIRLICYHVFHWNCLYERQLSLPLNTAPGGHQCPTCKHPIIPPRNLISPVADYLRKILRNVEWAKSDLDTDDTETIDSDDKSSLIAVPSVSPIVHSGGIDSNRINGIKANSSSTNNRHTSPHSVLLMESFSPPSHTSDLQANSRKPLLARESPIGGIDRDDNKYKKRTPSEIFSRWSRRFYVPSSRPLWKRMWVMITLGIFAFILLIYIMSWLGRSSTYNDSQWDIENNPNINHEN